MITTIEPSFTGTGEVSGFQFRVRHKSEGYYIYKVKAGTQQHFEVFEVRTVPLCLDFENRIYSETDFKEVYPKSNDFGIWAWTCESMTHAHEIIEKQKNKKQ